MLNLSKQYHNVPYHPIMDNFKKYENVTKTPFNPALKFQFAFGISTAFNMCPRPCIDVTYSTAVDKFFFSSEEEMVDATGCEMGNGVMVMSYQRIMDYELVKLFHNMFCFNLHADD